MQNYYPDELIEDIRVNNDIVDVVSEYVKLDKKGKDYFGLCPFHKEKTPSFSVVPSKQIFYCFGCGKGGNVIQFVMNAENLDYIEALKYLADRVKIQLPEGENKEDIEKAKLKQEILKINTEAARFFHTELSAPKSENAQKYLANRSIREQTVRKFGLGYSPEGWDQLYNYLLSRDFDEKAVVSSGLVLPKKNGGYYDRFRGRIMFPIFDIRGNIIGFGGRVIDASQPKYMNSPETPVYSKGKQLYALNFAKNSNTKKLIVVEGYMDVISLHQSGIINTVASLGTALTESQGRILKKYADEIVISYDADTAGQAATMRGLDLLNEMGCTVKVLQIPDGKDPDEYVRKNGVDGFKKLVDNSLSLIEYKVKVLKGQINIDSTAGKLSFINKIADVLAKVDNRIEIEMNVKKLAREYEISEESIYSEIYRRNKPKTSLKTAALDLNIIKNAKKPLDENKDKERVHDERMLISLLSIDNRMYEAVKDKITEEDFTDEENKRVYRNVVERLENKKGIVPGELLNILSEETANDFTRIIQKECNCEDNFKAVMDIIKRMEINKLQKRKQEILGLLGNRDRLPKGDVEKLTLELNSIIIKMKSV